MVVALRQASRIFRRHPGFAWTVAGILGMGIAAAPIIFSVVDALVRDPFPQPKRFVVVGTEVPRLQLPPGVGLLAAWALARGLASSLEAIEELETWIFLIPAVALFATALLASAVPARQACRVDPAAALRED